MQYALQSQSVERLSQIAMTHVPNTLFKVLGLRIKYLQPKDTALLQALLEKSSDYIQLVTGLPPAPSAAYSLMRDGPEGKTSDDKLVIGVFAKEQDLIGVLDVIRGYPIQNDWWLGLLLLAPAYRSQGLGRRIYHAFEQWASQHGAENICLGVVKENQGACRFWQKLGFETVKKKTAQLGNVEHTIITMARALTK